MTKPNPARRWFAAALGLYLAWVGVLTAMAVTSSKRPPHPLVPGAADSHRTHAPNP